MQPSLTGQLEQTICRKGSHLSKLLTPLESETTAVEEPGNTWP